MVYVGGGLEGVYCSADVVQVGLYSTDWGRGRGEGGTVMEGCVPTHLEGANIQL